MTVVTLNRRGIALQTGKNYRVQQYQVLKTGINKNSAQHGITITLSSSVSDTTLVGIWNSPRMSIFVILSNVSLIWKSGVSPGSKAACFKSLRGRNADFSQQLEWCHN